MHMTTCSVEGVLNYVIIIVRLIRTEAPESSVAE
jgi:hypothetical protein